MPKTSIHSIRGSQIATHTLIFALLLYIMVIIWGHAEAQKSFYRWPRFQSGEVLKRIPTANASKAKSWYCRNGVSMQYEFWGYSAPGYRSAGRVRWEGTRELPSLAWLEAAAGQDEGWVKDTGKQDDKLVIKAKTLFNPTPIPTPRVPAFLMHPISLCFSLLV